MTFREFLHQQNIYALFCGKFKSQEEAEHFISTYSKSEHALLFGIPWGNLDQTSFDYWEEVERRWQDELKEKPKTTQDALEGLLGTVDKFVDDMGGLFNKGNCTTKDKPYTAEEIKRLQQPHVIDRILELEY